jgi:hypothetical protein
MDVRFLSDLRILCLSDSRIRQVTRWRPCAESIETNQKLILAFSRYLPFLYYGIMLILIGLGVAIFITKSWHFPVQLLSQLGYLSIPAEPYSLLIWPSMAILLSRKFLIFNSFLMVGFLYCIWDLGDSFFNNVFNGFFVPLVPAEIGLLIILSFVLKNKIKANFTHLWSIVVFLYYVQNPVAVIFPHVPFIGNWQEMGGELVFSAWALKSFNPK